MNEPQKTQPCLHCYHATGRSWPRSQCCYCGEPTILHRLPRKLAPGEQHGPYLPKQAQP